MIGIYLIINCTNDKIYVGSSANVNRRFSNHTNKLERNCHPNKHLQSAWNFYGADAFHFCVVEECSINDLEKIEQKWIDASRAYFNGYNLTPLADRYSGVVTEEARFKLAEASRNRKISNETRIKMGLSRKGKPRPFHAKPPSWLGRKHTEESKQKISASLRRKALDQV